MKSREWEMSQKSGWGLANVSMIRPPVSAHWTPFQNVPKEWLSGSPEKKNLLCRKVHSSQRQKEFLIVSHYSIGDWEPTQALARKSAADFWQSLRLFKMRKLRVKGKQSWGRGRDSWEVPRISLHHIRTIMQLAQVSWIWGWMVSEFAGPELISRLRELSLRLESISQWNTSLFW